MIKDSNPELYKTALALNPTGRMGTPQEMANAAVFLASRAASFITGNEPRRGRCLDARRPVLRRRVNGLMLVTGVSGFGVRPIGKLEWNWSEGRRRWQDHAAIAVLEANSDDNRTSACLRISCTTNPSPSYRNSFVAGSCCLPRSPKRR